MKFKGGLIFITLIVLMMGAIFESTAQEKFSVDKVVAVVGNSVILYSDVDEAGKQLIEERKGRGYTLDRDPMVEALELLMEQKLLYNQALIDSVNINVASVAQMAEERVAELIKQMGGVSKVEELFHRPIYEVKREISYRIEEGQYANEMMRSVTDKVGITPGEVEKFYNNIHKDSLPIIPIQYVYGQITKYPLSTEEAKLRTREQLLDIRRRIVEGTRFDVLARMYSEDGSAIRGGELDPAPAEQYEAPFAKALEKLRPGQVSEIVETIYGFHIIELLDKQDNLYHLRHILLRPKFTDEELYKTSDVLNDLVQKIRSDSITFENTAKLHSDDKYSRMNGGLVSNLELMEMYFNMEASLATTRHFKEDLPPEDFLALDKLKPGEISPAFKAADSKGNQLSKVVKLIEIIPAHPASLKEDYLRLEQMALVDKQEREYHNWLTKKIRTMFIRVSPEFNKPEEFKVKEWLK